MKYNNYNRNTLIKIIKKREALDYRSLFNECFNLLQSIVANEQKKRNFNDCINKAEWTEKVIKQTKGV